VQAPRLAHHGGAGHALHAAAAGELTSLRQERSHEDCVGGVVAAFVLGGVGELAGPVAATVASVVSVVITAISITAAEGE
jgi:hypothetical protein